MGKRGLSMTDDEILDALHLRDQGLTWEQIASRLGRNWRAWQKRVNAVHRETDASEAGHG